MRALVKFGNQDGEVEIRDVPVPSFGPDDVLLQVKAVGVCGWDIEMWRHKMANPVTVPVVQGHEFCGVVAKAGADVRDVKEGDRVVSETSADVCGRCVQCLNGDYHVCARRKGFGYGVDGAFTDFVRVPRRCLHRMPEGIPFEQAAITEPACVAYQALVALSRIPPGTPVLIVGPGPVGLMALQIAKISGACPVFIVGVEKDGPRFDVARRFGADVVINASKEDPRRIVLDATRGEGVPLAVDAAGNEHALKLAVDLVARQGQITKIGWGPKPINFSLDPLLTKAVRLQGTFSHNWPTWEAVLALIGRGMLKTGPVISHRFRLDQWKETFHAIEEGEAVKAVMLFDR